MSYTYTSTYAMLAVSPEAHKEVEQSLREAGYADDDIFIDEISSKAGNLPDYCPVIALNNIGLVQKTTCPASPAATTEPVKKTFMNKLAKLLTKAEEALGQGDSEVDISLLAANRGDLLDLLDDPEIFEWLKKMRDSSRCPYRRWQVSKQ